MNRTVNLDELIGEHMLGGVDFGTRPKGPGEWYDGDEAHTMSFVLDGASYTAQEDPSDGYRSSMDRLEVGTAEVVNRFEPQRVVASKRPDDNDYHGGRNDVIDMHDSVTGKLVLSVGTTNTDDYYPSYEASFYPENMACNAGVE